MTVLEEIERDLRAFADPWSPVIVEKAQAVWERDGTEVSIGFAAPADQSAFPDVITGGQRVPYRSFLAGPQMANLATFAEFITKTHERKVGEYIDTWASLIEDSSQGATRKPATDLVRERGTENLPFLS